MGDRRAANGVDDAALQTAAIDGADSDAGGIDGVRIAESFAERQRKLRDDRAAAVRMPDHRQAA